MTARAHRSAPAHDWRLGRYVMPQMTVRRALGHLLAPLLPAVISLATGHVLAALVWTTLGGLLFVVRNKAVAWEVAQGWHDPVYGPMLQRRRQAEHDRLTRPLAVVMGVALVTVTAGLMLLEQHHLIRLPTPHPVAPLGPDPALPPCCPSLGPSHEVVVHQTWSGMLHATLRVR